MQTDAYEVYQALERKDATLERIGCLVTPGGASIRR